MSFFNSFLSLYVLFNLTPPPKQPVKLKKIKKNTEDYFAREALTFLIGEKI